MASIGVRPIARSRSLWDSTRLRLLVEIERQGSVSAAAARDRDRPAERERAPAPPRGGRRAAARRAKRPRQPAHRGRPASSPPRRARRSRRSAQARRSSHAPRRTRGGNDPHRRLDDARASTCSRTRSAASGATTPTSPSRSRSPRPARSSSGFSPAGVQLALVGETDADERIALEPFLSRRDRRHRQTRARCRPTAARSNRARSPSRRSSSARPTLEHAAGQRPRPREPPASSPRRLWELDSSEAIKRAAREGLGVAFLSRYAVAEEIERGELERFRLGRPAPDRAQPPRRPARPPALEPERARLRRDAHPLLRQERGVRRRPASPSAALGGKTVRPIAVH